MKEILSQGEIDAILSAVATGRVKAEDLRETEAQAAYKPYDFRRPNKFSKDQLRTLQTLHEGYARILSNFLSGYLSANIVVRVASVDQFTFDDFVRSVPVPTVLTIFSLKPLKGMAVMETNPQFLFPIIDLLFGGPGEIPKRVRELTDIELSVIRKLTGKLLESFQLAWQDVYNVEPQIESMETNPRLHQIISPNEIVAVITLTTVVGGSARGLINICLPHIVLDPM
ncbi:MAG: flagellar motor switch protein FliM, partial [Candidatus Desulforudis sp.]|nr:flagellar motor switch protein FliM [Desulforudis sp.]